MDIKDIRVKSLCTQLAYSLFVLLIICVVLQINHAYAGPSEYTLSIEKDTDRAGKDYKNFELSAPNPELCKAACEKDPKCKAYTYVKPGVQGQGAHCWLKSGVPKANKDQCCVSGVKSAKGTVAQKTTKEPDMVPKGPEMIPQGSYIQSCTDISVSGNKLTAICEAKGYTVRTTLKEIDLCVGDISNDNGNLTCQKSGNVPPGTYLQSCTHPSLSGTTLTAICRYESGFREKTTLKQIDLCRGDISNIDGHLHCEKTNAPPGSYLESCVNINVSGTTLSASCLRTLERYLGENYGKISTLEEFDRCVGDISNNKGNLTCQKMPPPGSYLESCTNAEVSGTTLTALCRTKEGGTHQATLEEIDLCRGDISNYDGYLTCLKRKTD